MKQGHIKVLSLFILCSLVIVNGNTIKGHGSIFIDALDPIWVRTWGDVGINAAYSIAEDDSGVYVACMAQKSQIVSADAFIRKYTHDGNLEWNKIYHTQDDDIFSDIKLYDSGIYVCGNRENTSMNIHDAFVAKYDVNGNLIWNTTWGGNVSDNVYSMAVDDSGVYLLGYTGNFTAGIFYSLLLKYDLDGNYQWNKTWGPDAYQLGGALTIDSSAVYAVGDNAFSVFILKYDKNGNVIWNRTWGETGFLCVSSSVSVDTDTLYFTGSIRNLSKSDENVFILKYNLDGTLIKEKIWGGPKVDSPNTIVTDDTNLYITGITNSYGSSAGNVYVLKCDKDCNELWNKTWNSNSSSYHISLWDSSIYVCGRLSGSSGHICDSFLLKTDLDGNTGIFEYLPIAVVFNVALIFIMVKRKKSSGSRL